MDNETIPKLAKWPFYLGDLLLLVFAAYVLYVPGSSLDYGRILSGGGAILVGAWLSVLPFLLQYRAAVKLTETAWLISTVEQIKKLETLGGQIGNATAQWQVAHEMSEKTVQTAKAISERMAAEAKAFTEFLAKADETEKRHLRLEVDKARRAEGEWLQTTTTLLDHVYALRQAALRAGQPNLINQLSNFQNACREVVRRIGLAPVTPAENDPFDPKLHQLIEGEPETPPVGARVGTIIATGYTYQGQLLRRAVVALQPEVPEEQPPVLSVSTTQMAANDQTSEPAEPPPQTVPQTVSQTEPTTTEPSQAESAYPSTPRINPPADQQLF